MHTDDEFPRVFGIKDQDPRGVIKLPNSSPHSGPENPSSYSHILAGMYLLLTPPSSSFFPFRFDRRNILGRTQTEHICM